MLYHNRVSLKTQHNNNRHTTKQKNNRVISLSAGIYKFQIIFQDSSLNIYKILYLYCVYIKNTF